MILTWGLRLADRASSGVRARASESMDAALAIDSPLMACTRLLSSISSRPSSWMRTRWPWGFVQRLEMRDHLVEQVRLHERGGHGVMGQLG